MTNTVFHENIRLPLFHLYYDVVVGYNMQELKTFVEEMFTGVKLDQLEVNDCTGYTCVVKHPKHGSHVVMILSLDMQNDTVGINRRVAHECTHLTWYIMDIMGITVDVDNHELQSYLMEEVCEKVNNVVQKFLNGDTSLENL